MLKENCYFYTEYQDMGARIPCCTRYTQLGKCPCDDCNRFLDITDAQKIIKKYSDGELITNGWIPVTERLPEDSDKVLTVDGMTEKVLATDGTDIFVAWRKDGRWFSNDPIYFEYSHPMSYWIPSPKLPYKEKEII